MQAQLHELKEQCLFIEKSNKGGEFMSEDAKQKVRDIAAYRWLDHTGIEQPMLSEQEVAFLCIERGTITYDERQKINNHMTVTIQMLESLPFPKTSNVCLNMRVVITKKWMERAFLKA
jgi:hypothetical protein